MSQVPTTERRSVTSQLAAVMGAVIALAASLLGCAQDEECTPTEVVCASELHLTASLSDGKVATWTVYLPNGKKPDMTQYKMGVVVSTPFSNIQTEGTSGANFLKIQLQDEYHKAVFKVYGKNADAQAARTAGINTMCFDVNGEKQDCKAWDEDKKNVVTVIDTEEKAKARSSAVRCVKFTYTRTKNQDDFTWVVKSFDNFKFNVEATVMGSTTSAEAFTSTGEGFPVTIDNGKVIMSTTPLSMRLPFPPSTQWEDLRGEDKDTLRAGFTVDSSATPIKAGVAGNYTMGCNILQKTLKSILNDALKGAPITTEKTLHILFPTSDYAYIAGDHGWCYKLSPTGQTPLLKEFDSSTSGTECEDQ